ncbi:Protein of unknown function (DUF3808) [Diplonema papillatum]|nr:Protein of unknown function (DUF3808) [Diplonema papillatum]
MSDSEHDDYRSLADYRLASPGSSVGEGTVLDEEEVQVHQQARDAAADMFECITATQLGAADRLGRAWRTKHPRVLIEYAHLQLVNGLLSGSHDAYTKPIALYLAAADWADGIETVLPDSEAADEAAPWHVWARATARRVAGTACRTDASSGLAVSGINNNSNNNNPANGTPGRKRAATSPWKPLTAFEAPAPDARSAEEEDVVVARWGGDTGVSRPPPRSLQLRDPPSPHTPSGGCHAGLAGTAQTTPLGSASGGALDSYFGGSGAQEGTPATSSSPAPQARLTARRCVEMEMAALSAFARTLAALLLLRSSRYAAAGPPLERAWAACQPLRQAVHAGGVPRHLEEDVMLSVATLQMCAVEYPDGLRRVLGSIAPLAHMGGEGEWMMHIFGTSGHRSLHAGIALVLNRVNHPGLADTDRPTVQAEGQALQALLLRYPGSPILHILSSFQRRRHGDGRGALDAIAAAKAAWVDSDPSVSGRASNGKLPPALVMAEADANYAALRHREAAKGYRRVLDVSIVTGQPLEFLGRASLRLAGAMTLFGLQKWPGDPWGQADEWILHAVVAARTDRREEETVAGAAARFSSQAHLRPLLPFWLLFQMGDLEVLGGPERSEATALLAALAHGNPAAPPQEDFLAYAEGRALWRLLFGAAVRRTEPERAKALWRKTLNDPTLKNDSVALAYSQCLLGEEELRVRHRSQLAVRMLLTGSELLGDRSHYLRTRYGAALQSLDEAYVDELPGCWAILFNQPQRVLEEESVQYTPVLQGVPVPRMTPSASDWLGPVMEQRKETKGMVEATVSKLRMARPELPSLMEFTARGSVAPKPGGSGAPPPAAPPKRKLLRKRAGSAPAAELEVMLPVLPDNNNRRASCAAGTLLSGGSRRVSIFDETSQLLKAVEDAVNS